MLATRMDKDIYKFNRRQTFILKVYVLFMVFIISVNWLMQNNYSSLAANCIGIVLICVTIITFLFLYSSDYIFNCSCFDTWNRKYVLFSLILLPISAIATLLALCRVDFQNWESMETFVMSTFGLPIFSYAALSAFSSFLRKSQN